MGSHEKKLLAVLIMGVGVWCVQHPADISELIGYGVAFVFLAWLLSKGLDILGDVLIAVLNVYSWFSDRLRGLPRQ